jgi:hypothetical protein
VKFQVLDIIPHLKNPLTGEIVSTADRLNQVVATARRAEELGFDSFSVGERHAGEFISSSPTTVLAGIAAVTTGSGCRAVSRCWPCWIRSGLQRITPPSTS